MEVVPTRDFAAVRLRIGSLGGAVIATSRAKQLLLGAGGPVFRLPTSEWGTALEGGWLLRRWGAVGVLHERRP